MCIQPGPIMPFFVVQNVDVSAISDGTVNTHVGTTEEYGGESVPIATRVTK